MGWILTALVLLGLAMSRQDPMNGGLKRELGGAIPAVVLSFGVGFAVLIVIALAQGGALVNLPQVPGWSLICGCLGAFYVLSAVWGLSFLGILTLVAALILGQMAALSVIDATGALSASVREITPTRIAAALLVMAALILSRA